MGPPPRPCQLRTHLVPRQPNGALGAGQTLRENSGVLRRDPQPHRDTPLAPPSLTCGPGFPCCPGGPGSPWIPWVGGRGKSISTTPKKPRRHPPVPSLGLIWGGGSQRGTHHVAFGSWRAVDAAGTLWGEGGSLRALHPKVTPHRKKPGRTDTDGQTDAAPYRWSRGAGGTPGTDEPPHALEPRMEVLAGGGLSPNLPTKKLQGGGIPWAEAPQMCLSWFFVPPPSSWGWGTTEAGPPHGYSRVPPVVPAVPASRRSPGRDREELSVSPPRHQDLILPWTTPPPGSSPWLLSPRGCPQVLASPRHPRGRRGGEGTRGRVVAGGDVARWHLPCGLSPPVAPANHRSPGHPVGHKMSPRPPPQKKKGGRGHPGTPSTLGPVSPGSPLAPSAPARPCERKPGGEEGAKSSVPPPRGEGASLGHPWLRVAAG